MESEIKFRPSNTKAIGFLLTPCTILVAAISSFYLKGIQFYFTGILLLSLFFTQTFFILHECGHLNFFPSKWTNKIVGNIAGFLSGIPFYTWMHMHNLHHKWTGWRDLDPTTEKTVQLNRKGFLKFVVNLAWFCFIPLFYLIYLFSNYWNVKKIRRFTNEKVYQRSVPVLLIYLILYALSFYFFKPILLAYCLPSYILSLVWKELVILTQHTHIEIPVSEGKLVRPISYVDQIQYTRSFYVNRLISKLFFLNFNLHETHHAYPGMPAYWLEAADVNTKKAPKYWHWFRQAKSMKGEDFIFKTSKHTGKKF